MSTDRAKDQQDQSQALADVTPSTRATPSTGIAFAAETEISDETLEAVAGGGATPPSKQSQLDHD